MIGHGWFVRLLCLLLMGVVVAFTIVGTVMLHWSWAPDAAWPVAPCIAIFILGCVLVTYPDEGF